MSSYNPRNKIATRTRLSEVRYEIRGELARRARELEGQGQISGVGSLGEITAKSYGVYDKGERLVFKGGVRGRLDSK